MLVRLLSLGAAIVLVRLGTPSCDWTLKIGPCLTPREVTGGVGVADGVGMGPREDCLGWAGQGKNLALLEKRKERTVNACS